MKRRWTILFWSALATLIGISWLAARWGLSVTSMMNVGLVGMILACGCAFYAMIRAHAAKWPAAIVLVCAGPLTIDMLRALPDVALIVRYFGVPGALMIGGTLATTGYAIAILVMKPPRPPKPPQVAPARVVDS